jgi:hypothetical protein
MVDRNDEIPELMEDDDQAVANDEGMDDEEWEEGDAEETDDDASPGNA